MKKATAFLIILSMIFLCACSDNENTDTKTTTVAAERATTHTTANNTTVRYITEWGIDLLPDDFPAPPSGAYNFEYENGEANKAYASDWVSIRFTCPENEIYRFTNELKKAGYIGGAKKIASPSSYFPSGFNGYWQNGKNYIRVAASQYGKNGELTLVIDIAECKDNFPMVLTSVFPKFNGYAKNPGVYNEYDENRNPLDNEFIGSLNAKSWSWDFCFENAFVGVTLEEVETYANKLGDADFSGTRSINAVDGCTVVSYDLVKKIDDNIYGVFIVYNQIFQTMDIVYSKNI